MRTGDIPAHIDLCSQRIIGIEYPVDLEAGEWTDLQSKIKLAEGANDRVLY